MYWYHNYWHLAHGAVLPSISQHLVGEVVDLPDGDLHYGGEEDGGHLHDRVLHRPTVYAKNPIDVVSHLGDSITVAMAVPLHIHGLSASSNPSS